MAVLLYRPKVALAILTGLVAVAIPWFYVVRTLSTARPISTPPASSVFWGSVYFNTARDLSHWLHRRGVAYSVWAHRHPPAAARIGRGYR